MSASPSHPVTAPVDLNAGAAASPRLPPLCDVRVPISATSSITRFPVSHTSRVRIGRRVLFRRESLEQWLEEVEASVPRIAAG
jgi:hypothetical protein